MGDYVKSLVSVVPTILLHNKFKLCITNRDRYLAHLLVFLGFVGLFIVTNIGFFGLYIVRSDFLAPPYTFANPVKLFGLAAGIALLVGIILVIRNRLKPKAAESTITYLDWSLIIAVSVTAATGMLTWLGRVANAGTIAYIIYFVHLASVFYIIAYLPYSKLAHLVYRTAAMGYAAHIDRPFGVEVSAPAAVAVASAPEPAPTAEEPVVEEAAAEVEAQPEEEAEAPAETVEAKSEEEEKKD